MAGRKKTKVTSLFKNIESTSKINRVKCNFCSITLAKAGSRMTKHIQGCKKCPKNVKEKYLELDDSPVSDSFVRKSLFQRSHSEPSQVSKINTSEIISKKKSLDLHEQIAGTSSTVISSCGCLQSTDQTPFKKSRTSIDSYVDKVSKEENDVVTTAMARAIFSSGTPFSIVENQDWLNFFNLLRPAYKPPSRKTLSTTLLDNQVKMISTSVHELVAECDTVGLMCDGWSNIRNQPIINFILTMPKPVFWKTLGTGTDSHTGEYIAEEIITVIKDVAEKTDAKVLGIVTDNAANMKKAWQIITDKYPSIVCYGCAAHSLDLIFSDFNKLNSFQSLITKVSNLVKEFKNSHLLGALLRKYQEPTKTISLKLPVKTRWGSTINCLRSVQANKNALRKLIIDVEQEENIKISVSNQTESNILSQPFWDAINGFINLLGPLADAITKVETDQPMMSNIVPVFNSLKETFDAYVHLSALSKDDEKLAFKIMEHRREFCLKIIHKAANLLDPQFIGSHLSPEEQVDVMEYISDLAEKIPFIDHMKVIEDLSHYLAKEGFFSKQFLWTTVQSISPTAWWTGLCRTTELSKLAAAILKLPATTAGVERSFSSYSNIHTAKRNRLTVKRAGKLVYISQNLRLQNQFANKHCHAKLDTPDKAPHASTSLSNQPFNPVEIIDIDSELEVTSISEDSE